MSTIEYEVSETKDLIRFVLEVFKPLIETIRVVDPEAPRELYRDTSVNEIAK